MIPNAKIGSHHASNQIETGFFPHQRNKKLKYSKSNKIMIESTETEPKIVPAAQNNRFSNHSHSVETPFVLNHSHSVETPFVLNHSHSVGSSLNLHNNTISSKINFFLESIINTLQESLTRPSQE